MTGPRRRACIGSPVDLQLVEDVVDVDPDRGHLDAQPRNDLLIRKILSHRRGDFALPPRQLRPRGAQVEF